jgi:phosphate transport system substrate-binding protein
MQKLGLVTTILVLCLSIMSISAANSTVADTLRAEDFSTLAGLLAGVELPEGATVFLPTNEAFAALPEAVLNYVLSHEELLNAVLAAHISTDMVELVEGDVYQDVIIIAVLDGGYVVDSVIIPDVELASVDPLDYSDGSIVTAGSSTVFPLAERLGELWSDLGGVAPSIDSIGSGAGFERFCETGETDISNASRAIKDGEVESCAAIGRSPIEFRVGTDALAVTISASNDFVSDVTTEELALIFSTASNWNDVRAEWPTEPICRFIPGTDSGTFDYFVEEIYDEDEAPILAASCLQLSEDDNVLVQGIQDSPYAVGFFGFAYYQENADTLHILNVNGVEPNGITAEDGSYPLARPLFMYSDAQILGDKPEVAAFLNYVLTNVNDEIVDVGYFPASARALNLARLGLLASGIYE